MKATGISRAAVPKRVGDFFWSIGEALEGLLGLSGRAMMGLSTIMAWTLVAWSVFHRVDLPAGVVSVYGLILGGYVINRTANDLKKGGKK